MDSFAPSPSLESCEVSSLVQRVRQFFAPPPPPVELPRHIAERDARRCECACRLLEFLAGPDGLNLSGINLGRIARAIGIKYKHAIRALADLGRVGVFAGRTVTLFGNGCGHDPERPRWFSQPVHHKNHPKIIERTIERIREYYADPRAVLPGLNHARPFLNGKNRQRRSERREACVDLLAAILWHTDLITLKVGRFTSDGEMTSGIPMDSKDVTLASGQQVHIVGWAELAGLTLSRAEEAMRDLKAAGIVTVHEICERVDATTYKGYSAIRTVSKHLFEAFKLGEWLARERRDAMERLAKRKRKKDMQVDTSGKANLDMLVGAQRKGKKKGHVARQEKANEQAKNRNAILFRLIEEFPGRIDEIGALMGQHRTASADDLAAMLSGTGPP